MDSRDEGFRAGSDEPHGQDDHFSADEDSTDLPEKPDTWWKCEAALNRDYFTVNGTVACVTCKDELVSEFVNGESSFILFLRAVLLGGIGAVIGVGLYFGIAILHWVPSRARGDCGWGHRRGDGPSRCERAWWVVLSVHRDLPAYVAVSSTYVYSTVDRWGGVFSESPAAEESWSGEDGSANDRPGDFTVDEPDPVGAAPSSEDAAQPGTSENTDAIEATIPEMALGIAILLVLNLAEPFLLGWDNAMGILFVGIAVLQAASMNKREPLEVTGPILLSPT